MKYFILILSIFVSILAISCSDSSNNNQTNDNLGNEGYNCKKDKSCNDKLICNRNNICEKDNYDAKAGTINNPCRSDKSCDAGLICNTNNICEKQADEHLGEEGYACKANKVCNADLVCNLQNICEKQQVDEHAGEEGHICKENHACNTDLVCNLQNICEMQQVDEHLGEEGYACKADKVCNYDLFCNTDNLCEKNNTVDFGKEGKPCIKVGDKKCLTDNLFCNEYDICEKMQGTRGEEGSLCNIDGTCNAGLMCALEDICMNETDFYSGDENQSCRVTDDSMEFCYDGLSCDTFGECQLDCSIGNDSLCDDNGAFDFSPYAGTYKLIRFDETTSCGTNNYSPKDNVGYEYFQLTFENYYGFKYLGFHDCQALGTCSSSEKSYYKVVDTDGAELMEFASENTDGSCTYTAIDTHIRMLGNKLRIRYVFNEDTVTNSSEECSSLNVHNHYGEMSCSKIRLIDGIKQ